MVLAALHFLELLLSSWILSSLSRVFTARISSCDLNLRCVPSTVHTWPGKYSRQYPSKSPQSCRCNFTVPTLPCWSGDYLQNSKFVFTVVCSLRLRLSCLLLGVVLRKSAGGLSLSRTLKYNARPSRFNTSPDEQRSYKSESASRGAPVVLFLRATLSTTIILQRTVHTVQYHVEGNHGARTFSGSPIAPYALR